MTTINKIWTGVVAVLVILLIWQFSHSKNLENKLIVSEQNKKALLDSVRTMKTKNGELESARIALAGSKKDLEKLSADLSRELKKEKGKVKTITQVEIQYKTDSSNNPSTASLIDSIGTIRADIEDSCRIFRGYTSFILSKGKITDPRFILERDEFNLNLITGLRERDKQIEIFVRSSCPGVTIQDIQGAIIDPNDPLIKPKKPWFTWKDALEITGGIAIGFIIGRQ
jgi:hypothetical protein